MKRGINVVELEPVHGMGIRKMLPVSGLPDFFGAAFGRLGEYIGREGGKVSGMPLAVYYSVTESAVDVEAVLPAVFDVLENLPSEGDIIPADLPGGPAVEYVYFGPYDGMAPIYGEIEQWLQDNGKVSAGPPREVYHSEPAGDPSTWETHVIWRFA